MDLIDKILNDIDDLPRPVRRPIVTISFAQSLDGSIATQKGVRTQISGPESARLTHQMRANHDAILVGIGTVLADDPQLTVRLVDGANPRPVILDTRLRIPPDSALILHNSPWIATAEDADASKAEKLIALGAELFYLPTSKSGQVQLPVLLETLQEAGVERLMVEGGARVLASFLAAQLVDYLVVTVSPLILGGLPALQLPGSDANIGEVLRIEKMNAEPVGEDLVLFGYLQRVKTKAV
jgi:riboflavin-specific deaminase-like protein